MFMNFTNFRNYSFPIVRSLDKKKLTSTQR